MHNDKIVSFFLFWLFRHFSGFLVSIIRHVNKMYNDRLSFFLFLGCFCNLLEFWCLSLDIWHYFSLFHFKASLLWIYSFIFTLFRDCAGQSSTNQYPLFPPTRKPFYKVDFFSYLFSVSIFLSFWSINNSSLSSSLLLQNNLFAL